MLEDSTSAIPSSSLWASMNSWLTPTVLFLLLNLMIATIAFTSHFSKKPPSPAAAALARSPSLLHRLKSFNNLYSSPPPPPSSLHHKQIPDSDAHATHYFFPPQETPISAVQTAPEIPSHFDSDQKAPIFADFEEAHEAEMAAAAAAEENLDKSMDEVYNQLADSHFSRTKSDTKPTGGEIPAKLAAKMRKSASVKSPFNHFEEGDIVEARRPATERPPPSAAADDGVDAKADDFINRFKQQLKLQRLDSIIRYKDMIGRAR